MRRITETLPEDVRESIRGFATYVDKISAHPSVELAQTDSRAFEAVQSNALKTFQQLTPKEAETILSHSLTFYGFLLERNIDTSDAFEKIEKVKLRVWVVKSLTYLAAFITICFISAFFLADKLNCSPATQSEFLKSLLEFGKLLIGATSKELP